MPLARHSTLHADPQGPRGVLHAGRTLNRVLGELAARCRPGLALTDLDRLARGLLGRESAEPALPGYSDPLANAPYPAALSIGLNDRPIGPPEPGRAFAEGDLVTLDLAVRKDGWYADAALTWVIPGGPLYPSRVNLARASRAVTAAGIAACLPGVDWPVVVRAMHAESGRWGVCLMPGFWSHGIGRRLHQPPTLPQHPSQAGKVDPLDLRLTPGMTLTIEPVVAACRTGRVRDGWAERTADGADACYTEATVLVGRSKPRVLAGMILEPA